jgi:hypothetical protein
MRLDECTVRQLAPWCAAPRRSPSSATTCWPTCSTCSPAATPATSSPSCGPASCGTASGDVVRARDGASGWPSPAAAPSPTAACSACSCPTAPASASSTRRWSTRARGRDVPARRQSRGASRTSPTSGWSSRRRPASRARCRSGTATARAARSSSGRALGAFVREIRALPADAERCSGSRTTRLDAWPRTTCSLPARAGRGHRVPCPTTARSSSSASATRSATGGSASSARSAPGARAVGDGASSAARCERLRHAGRDDVERRRHRAAPARGRRRAAARDLLIDPDEIDETGRLDPAADVAVRRPLPRVPRPCAAAAARAGPIAHAAVAAAPTAADLLAVASKYPTFPILLETTRECLQRRVRPAGAARGAGAAAQPRPSGGQRRHPAASPFAQSRCCSTGSPRTCTRATPAGRAPGRRAVARPRPAARPAGRRGAARAARPRRARRPRAGAAAAGRRPPRPHRDELHDVLPFTVEDLALASASPSTCDGCARRARSRRSGGAR